MTIRELEAGDDLAAAVDLLCRFFAEEDFPTEADAIADHVRKMLALDTCRLFLMDVEGEAVGIVTVSLEFGIQSMSRQSAKRFGDKDMLQHIDLARVLFGGMIPSRRDARQYGWWAEMGDLYVLPGHRGRGYSRLLVAAAETFLKARGVAGYQVTVTPQAQDHHGLKNFYDALGFVSEGREILRKSLL